MLNALSTSISNIVSLFLQTLRFSALLPALCFVALNQFVLPQALGLDLKSCRALEFFQQPAWTVLLTIVIGYTLSALNIPIIRFFEGYPYRFTWWGARITESQTRKKRRLQWRAYFYQELYQTSQDILADEYEEELNTRLYSPMAAELGEVYYQLDNFFPKQDAYILPTGLGNSIAAFEEYPKRRYGIDAICLWSHLLPTLSEKQYSSFVEREKAALDFMLNMSLLMGIFAFEGIIIACSGYDLGARLFAASLLGAYFIFYRGAIASAFSWGQTVKVAFDLYRYELASQLSLKPVWSMSEERDQWERFSNFIRNPIQDCADYDYPLPKRDKP